MTRTAPTAAKYPEFEIRESEQPGCYGPPALLSEIAKLMRALARKGQEGDDTLRQATASRREFLLALLETSDALDQAIALSEPSLRDGPCALLHEGIQVASHRLAEFLEQNEGVTPADVRPGMRFDPRLHEAIAVDDSGNAPNGTIVAVNRRGYLWGDASLRRPRVTVAKDAKGHRDG